MHFSDRLLHLTNRQQSFTIRRIEWFVRSLFPMESTRQYWTTLNDPQYRYQALYPWKDHQKCTKSNQSTHRNCPWVSHPPGHGSSSIPGSCQNSCNTSLFNVFAMFQWYDVVVSVSPLIYQLGQLQLRQSWMISPGSPIDQMPLKPIVQRSDDVKLQMKFGVSHWRSLYFIFRQNLQSSFKFLS